MLALPSKGGGRGIEGRRQSSTSVQHNARRRRGRTEEHCNPVEKGKGRKFRIAGQEWEKKKNRFNNFP